MGILTTDEQAYYATAGSHGNYRLVDLQEIIDSFSATYVGEGKLCEGVTLNDITFHAIRGLQELSYDTLRSTRDLEVIVPSTLVLVMPVDFVNYVKLSWSDSNGIERVIYPTAKTSNPRKVTETIKEWGGFATGGANTDLTDSTESAGTGTNDTSDTWTNYKSNTTSDIGSQDADNADDTYGNIVGNRFGLDPQHAQGNGSFFIDELGGKFHFSSNISGKTVILKYISDGITTNAGNTAIDLAATYVPKLAEEAIYKHMLYGLLLAKRNTPNGLLVQLKKERFAETRKAKLRLSNLKPEELTQIFRGASKQIKH